MRYTLLIRALLVGAAAAVLALVPTDGYAQEAGHNVPGDLGMMSGSQPPSGLLNALELRHQSGADLGVRAALIPDRASGERP